MKYVCKWSALGICLLLAALTVLLVFPGLFAVHPMIVQSGSMEPLYPVGSMIYVKESNAAKLSEGMTVTFRLPEEDTFVTHRIVRVDKENACIYTKGDANELEDGMATPFALVTGRPVFCIPWLGYFAGYLSSAAGKVGIIMLVLLVCLLSWMESALQKQEKEACGE